MANNRNRTIYNVLALYASQVSPSGNQTAPDSVKQLSRVQSFDEDFSRNFTDVNQYGNLAAIDRIEVEAPTVNASFSYYVTNGENENLMGLTVSTPSSPSLTSCISGLLNKTSDEKNYYLLIVAEGNDAAGYNQTDSGVIAVGNGYLTSYSVNAAVGEIPTASVDLEGLNIRVYGELTPGGTQGPGVNPVNGQILTGVKFVLPQATSITGSTIPMALQPGDIDFTMAGALGFVNNNLKVQDFTLSFDLARTPLQQLGNRFAFSREIDFPVTATLEVNAQIGATEAGNLADLLCANPEHNFDIKLKKANCSGQGDTALMYSFKGAKLVSQNLTTSIGDNASMTATFEVQIGGPQDTSKGIFISGSY